MILIGKSLYFFKYREYSTIVTGAPRQIRAQPGYDLKIGSRSIRIGFLIGIVIAIAVSKSGSDFKMYIADRF